MRMRNHYKMGSIIYKKMAENNMPLQKLAFIFGNLAPDIGLTYIYRRHQHSTSMSHLDKLILRLYYGIFHPNSIIFSFRLGIITHYVCDYFCYAHNPAFKGHLREHIIYERKQHVDEEAMYPFQKQKSMDINFDELIATLDDYVFRYEQLLLENEQMSCSDIPMGVHVATWLASATYLYAEKPKFEYELQYEYDYEYEHELKFNE